GALRAWAARRSLADRVRALRAWAGRARAGRGPRLPRQLVQLLERLAQQARDLHLRDADAGGDLALGHVVGEAHLEDALLTLGQVSERRAEQRAGLGDAVAVVVVAQRVGDRRVAV